MREFQLESLADTQDLAKRLGTLLANAELGPMTVALVGDLGAGKTQFVRFLIEALQVPAEDITSPTYVLLQRHVGVKCCYHCDFYRLKSESEVWDLGLDELFESDCLVFVEWANLFPSCLPEDHLLCEFFLVEPESEGVQEDDSRRIENGPERRLMRMQGTGPKSREVLAQL